ncbi:glycoside hydrolase family 76 protein [Sporormia fimetaria CBS 119925]|uniref:mannan endo-1,6-alpha-mannosidase n=1 Tax=Sporormia fimetaria CBS 119925 TaxID=1340428 RepID=A0A6A6VFN0_9PLEO|nr:glycoside hydrolase family 76 protein [Sporormia fimetaria CBS 119925]
MHFISVGAALLYSVASVGAVDLDPNSEDSIKAATKQYAQGLMSFYKGDASGLPKEEVGVFPKPPYYWWQAGAAWGGLIEYTQLTGDRSYVSKLHQALVANYGPENNLLLPWKKDQEGNDDQAFWCLSLMSALEYQFADPAEAAPASYLEVVENCFNNIVPRWDTSSCGGGFKWQIYPENDYGWNYKNAISNGAVFALSARLARYTGKQTYMDWATKIWDWTKGIGIIGDNYAVIDGLDDRSECKEGDKIEWTYNNGMFLHGAAVMYNVTNGAADWKERTSGLLEHAGAFFSPFENATDVMYEAACEIGRSGGKCNVDQLSFKAYLARFLSKAAIMAPFAEDKVTKWLSKSAVAAGKACTGEGGMCGHKWYIGGWDGTTGVGQQQAALEVTQALLTLKKHVVPSKGGEERPSQPPQSDSPSPSKAPEETPAQTEAPPRGPTDNLEDGDTPEAPETPNGSESTTASDSVPTDGPDGHEEQQDSPASPTSCAPSTVTVWVTASTGLPPSSVPTSGLNTSVPVAPPMTGPPLDEFPPEEFEGAAASVQMTMVSWVVAVGGAVIFAVL